MQRSDPFELSNIYQATKARPAGARLLSELHALLERYWGWDPGGVRSAGGGLGWDPGGGAAPAVCGSE